MEGLAENEIIRLAAGLEQNSEHPIATGILKKAKEKGGSSAELDNKIATKSMDEN